MSEAEPWLSTFNLTVFNAAGVQRDELILAMVPDTTADKPDVAFRVLFRMDRERVHEMGAVETSCNAMLCFNPEEKSALMLDDEGRLTVVDSGGSSGGGRIPDVRGLMRAAARVGDHFAFVGWNGQCHLFAGGSEWINRSVPEALTKDIGAPKLNAVAGSGPDDLYACGDEGRIWHHDGTEWSFDQLDTKHTFHDIAVDEDGSVHACGQTGLLAKGRAGAFELIEPEKDLNDLWSIAVVGGQVFTAQLRALMVLGDQGLEPCTAAMDVAETFAELIVTDGILWSVGSKHVARFDGTAWTAENLRAIVMNEGL